MDRASCWSGAAPVSPEILKYFNSLGIEILNIYGSTETLGPQTVCFPGLGNTVGTVGRSYYGVNNKVIDPDASGKGELAARARSVFMGYKEEEENKRDEAYDGEKHDLLLEEFMKRREWFENNE